MTLDRKIFDDILVNLRSLEIDEVKERLESSMIGYSIESPIFDSGAFLYRARRLGPTFSKAGGIKLEDLVYPPKKVTPLGRLNRVGQPMFYASMHKESVFFEVPDLKAGDEIVLTFWKTNDRMFVNNIGYTEFAFIQLGAKRAVPTWGPPSAPGSTEESIKLAVLPKEAVDLALSNDRSREIKEAFSEYFMRKVASNETHLYKLTVAIAEMHLGSIVSHQTQFAGILYPSVRMWANADNVAILPWFVDGHVEFRKAVHVRIKDKTESSFDIENLDAAHEFDENGELKWLGRVRNWTLQPKQAGRFVFAAGVDSDGDYMISTDGVAAHWEAIDAGTGQLIEPQ